MKGGKGKKKKKTGYRHPIERDVYPILIIQTNK
jgi:hypothetical protein